MDFGKLFRVLVIGGSALGAGCDPDEVPVPDSGSAPDADVGTDAAIVAAKDSGGADSGAADAGSPFDAGEPGMCWCGPGPDMCCVDHSDGTRGPLAGFVCCWGTGC